MIKIAIVEDDKECAISLQGLLSRYAKEHGEDFNITYFEDGDEITDPYKTGFDIIFFDIKMKRMDGITASQYVRRFDQEVVIIFVTRMHQFALKGYSVDAKGFLIKPVAYLELAAVLRRVLKKIHTNPAHYLLCPIDGGTVKLETHTIMYIESFGHTMDIHTTEGRQKISISMDKLQEKLKICHFVRSSRSYLVNLKYVRSAKLSIGVTLQNKTILPLGRTYKQIFFDALTKYENEYF